MNIITGTAMESTINTINTLNKIDIHCCIKLNKFTIKRILRTKPTDLPKSITHKLRIDSFIFELTVTRTTAYNFE